MKHILITGGAGFLGSHLARRLATGGCPVVLLDHNWKNQPPDGNGIEVQQGVVRIAGDIVDYATLSDLLARYDFDGIVHLAALLTADCQRDPIGAAAVNCTGTANIFTLAAENGVRRVIFGSSVAVFDDDLTYTTGDDRPYGPSSVYGATKVFAEQLAGTMMASQPGLDLLGLRFGWLYGPDRVRGWTDMQTVIEDFALERTVVKYPDYKKANDWTYVEDAVEAIFRCLQAPPAPCVAYNVSGDYRSIKEAISYLSKHFPQVRVEPYPAALPAVGWQFTSDTITSETGFSYRISLEEGLDRTVNAIRQSHGLSPIY